MSSGSADRSRRPPPWRAALSLAAPAALLLAIAPPARAAAAVAISIRGNQAVAERALRAAAVDELGRLERLGGRRADADDATFQMTQAYRKLGYAFAEVSYRTLAEGETPAIEFSVSEGPRVALGAVAIEGAAAIPAAELRALFPGGARGLFAVAPPYVEADVRAAVAAVADLYLDRGYLDAAVRGPDVAFAADRTRADVRVAVSEGPQYRVRAATFAADAPPAAAEGLRQLERSLAGAVYRGPLELLVRGKVADLYGGLGYPEPVVRVGREPGPSPGDVLLRVEISSGPRVRITSVRIFGNRRTQERFIARRLRLAAGDWYDARKVRAAVRELYATGIFSRVDVGLAGDGGAGERVLRVDVEEVPAREVSLSVGWSAYEQLRGEAGVRHGNLFGSGRSAGLEGELSTKRASVTADLSDPRLLGTRLEARLPLSYRSDEEPSFRKRQVELAPQLSWRFSRALAATARYPLQYSWTGSYSGQVPPELAKENYRLARLTLQARYDARRGIFFPSRGLEATLSGDLADRVLGSQLSYVRVVGLLRWYLPLTGSTVLALRGESGAVVPTRGARDIPLTERFFLGGERSVRSFRESRLGPRDAAGEPLGGLGYNLLGVELRQRIAGNLSGALFADVGNIAPNRQADQPQAGPAAARGRDAVDALRSDFLHDFRAGVGVGVRYLLPIGPARLDVAWNPDARAGEPRRVLNLSVGIPF